MPKNKFDAFYYGVGIKVDEASIDEAGKKLEGKLNQVVDNVTQNLTTISDAIAKGVKDVDTKKLIQSIVDAQKELKHFQDFDPSKLQRQIDSLNTTVTSLSSSLGAVSSQLKDFTNDVASRLSNIEITNAAQGKKIFKADLELMTDYIKQMAKSGDIDASGVEKYINKIKDGFASLKASGNPMEIFADKDIAHSIVNITNILRQMGAPVEHLRSEFFELSSAYKTIFEGTNVTGSRSVFKQIGYQIESADAKLKKSKTQLADYQAQIEKLNSRRKTTGLDVIKEDQDLDFESKIKKIQEYDNIVTKYNAGSEEWYDAYKKQIALIQAAEKELSQLVKQSNGAQYMKKWTDAFGTYDLDIDKYSKFALSDYIEQAQADIVVVGKLYGEAYKEVKLGKTRLNDLVAQEGDVQVSTIKKQSTKNAITAVKLKAEVNEGEWAKTINAALFKLETEKKINPIKIPVTTTQGKTLESIQEQAKKIREMALANPNNDGSSDAKHFNHRFDGFLANLKTRKQELQDYLKNDWQKALQDAFTFRLEVLGVDKKPMTENIATNILPIVDAINMLLESKPLIFHSNIDSLIAEIQSKLQDIKIDIGAGNVSLNPQGLSNVNLIVNGLVGGGVPAVGVPSVVQPIVQPVVETPTEPQPTPPITSSGTVDKQSIYNHATNTIKEWLDGFTDPVKALELVKQQANKLYNTLINADEGTQEYYEAQIQLAVLLGKWRGTISGKYAKDGFKVPGVSKQWNDYLTNNGIIPDPKHAKVIGSMSALEKQYALKTPSDKSGSTRHSHKANTIETAEAQMATELENGKKIIDHYIKLAQWARVIHPLSEGVDKTLTEEDFKDQDVILRNKKLYDKRDIGKVMPGRKLGFDELDAFIEHYQQYDGVISEISGKEAELLKIQQQRAKLRPQLVQEQKSQEKARLDLQAERNKLTLAEFKQREQALNVPGAVHQQDQLLQNQEATLTSELQQLMKNNPEVKLFEFLRQVIDVYKTKQTAFDNLLNQLGESDIVGGYEFANNKTEFLTNSITNMLRSFAPMKKAAKQLDGMPTIYEFSAKPKTKAGEMVQKALSNVKNFETLVGQLYNTSNTNEQWEIIQKIIPELLSSLQKREESMGRPAGKNYTQLEQLLKLTQAYIPMSNSLQAVGREATNFISGTREEKDKYKKEWDKKSNRWYYTNEKIGTQQDLITAGLRQQLQGLAVVFIDELGNAIQGVNSGKNIANDYLGISKSTSFTKIITVLTNALTQASQIAIDTGRKSMKGYEGVTKWDPEAYARRQKRGTGDYKFTTSTTEKGVLEDRIQKLQKKINDDEQQLTKLEAELAKSNLSEADRDKLLSLPSTINSKQGDLTSQKSKAVSLASEIDSLKKQISNPEVVYEDVVTQLLSHKEILYSLQKTLSQKQQTAKSDTELAEIERLQSQISQEENTIKTLESSSGTAKRDVSDTKSRDLIVKEEAQLSQLKEQLSKLKEESQYKTNKETLNALTKEKESLMEQINQIKNQISLLPVKPRDTVAESTLIKQRDGLVNQLSTINTQIQSVQSSVLPYEDEVNYLSNLIAAKEGFIAGLKDIETRQRAQTSEELNNVLNGKLGELEKTNEEINKLENEISSLESQLMQIGDEGTRQVIVDAISKIRKLQYTINRNKKQLASDKQGLKDVSGEVKYSKTYDQALNDLPRAQASKQDAITDLKSLERMYITKQASLMADTLVKQQAGTITQKEVDAIIQSVPMIDELNQKLIAGKLSYQDYIKTVENAYIVMRQATTDEAKASAKADAKRLADAVELVRKYQEEEKLLQEIIKTQKPVAQPTTSSGSKTNNKPTATPTPTPSGTSSPATQTPTITPTQGVVSGVATAAMGGNIIANIAGAGLATESTVSAIYRLLSVKKNGDVDSQIEELKKAIATKEEEERVKAEEARRAKEAETKAKSEAEAKAKAEAEAKAKEKADADARAKAEMAAKKAAEQAAKAQKEAEKKKIEAAKKQVENETKKPIAENNKKAPPKQTASNDIYLEAMNKNISELFRVAKSDVKASQLFEQLFRERGFAIKNNKVVGITRGTNKMAPGLGNSLGDTYGHIHPRNTMYSAQDFAGMMTRRTNNASYNTDLLITPDYVYKITDLAKVTVDQIKQIQSMFDTISQDSVGMPLAIQTAAKEAILHHYGTAFGLKYSKNIIDEHNNLQDITALTEMFDKNTLDTLLEYAKFRGDKESKKDYASYKQKYDDYRAKLDKNSLYKSLSGIQNPNKAFEFASQEQGVAIQDALDQGWDLKLFFQELVQILDVIKQTGAHIPEASVLHKIMSAVSAVQNQNISLDEKTKVMDTIKPELMEFFGHEPKMHADVRNWKLYESKGIKYDWYGAYGPANKAFVDRYLKDSPPVNVDESNGDIMSRSIEELKAELVRLEALRDSSEVDPRFATAEKQDVIINLLKSGIKVSGKIGDAGSDTDSESEAKSKAKKVNMPSTAKVDAQTDAINQLTGINKDSALYKRYTSAKSHFDEAYQDALSKGENLTKQDADKVRALASEVTKLGRKIVEASSALDGFKSRGGQAFASTTNAAKTLKDEMLELAYQNASASKMLLSDVAYDEVTQKMSYSLTDLEGNVTKVSMAYNELFDSILTMSDKTTNSVAKIYKTIEGELINRIGVDDTVNKTPTFGQSKEYQGYLDAYNSMMNAQDQLRIKGELATKTEKDNLISLTNEVARTRSEFENLVKASAEFDAKIKDPANIKELPANFNVNTLEQEMKSFVLSQPGLTRAQREMIENTWVFKNAQDGATYSMRQGKDQIAAMSVEFDRGTNRIGRYTLETKKYTSGLESFMTSLKGKWKEVARYLMSFGSLYRVWAVLRRGVQYIKEIDTALTELKKVTNETEETYERFLNTAAKTADKIGSTIQEIVSSTADWARIGYSLQDAATLAESTAILLNVSEFQSIDDATSALTSTLQAFGYTAEQSMDVVDVLNEVKVTCLHIQ
jgi:hypothetical protein